MNQILHPEIIKILHGFIYRIRFLGVYIIIGILSLLLELAVRRQLELLGTNFYISASLSLAIGIVFAFFGNVYFNFRIPPIRRNRAFLYFVSISLFSGLLQWGVSRTVIDLEWSYEQGRLIISGVLFIVAYFLHRRFSFRDFKRVGVAIYANGVENLNSIHERIGHYPDFIHVDIVDSSFTSSPEEVKAYRMETIKALWRNQEIHTHIMSKTPSIWLSEVLPYSDIVYIHWECDEDIKTVLDIIHKADKKAGLALTMKTTLDDVGEIFKQMDAVLLLTISEPGYSGQKFDIEGLKRIEQLNELPFRDHFRVCVDGGINEKIISLVQVEDVVSGASVLNHSNPKQQILRLQTSGRYEVL